MNGEDYINQNLKNGTKLKIHKELLGKIKVSVIEEVRTPGMFKGIKGTEEPISPWIVLAPKED